MKTLLFLRHGKSDWDEPYEHDHDRPLASRGRKAAKKMGRLLASIDSIPDAAVVSTAVRAKSTYEIASRSGEWNTSVRETEALYGASPDDVLTEIWHEPDTASTLLLVGHEPTWSETVARLIGRAQIRYPTAALARVDVHVDSWKDVSFGTGTLVWLIPPKGLPDF